MAEVSNPTPPEYTGVSVENPTIREYIKNCAKKNLSKAEAQKLVGMPREVIDRYYKEEGK